MDMHIIYYQYTHRSWIGCALWKLWKMAWTSSREGYNITHNIVLKVFQKQCFGHWTFNNSAFCWALQCNKTMDFCVISSEIHSRVRRASIQRCLLWMNSTFHFALCPFFAWPNIFFCILSSFKVLSRKHSSSGSYFTMHPMKSVLSLSFLSAATFFSFLHEILALSSVWIVSYFYFPWCLLHAKLVLWQFAHLLWLVGK